jgi:adenylate kinase family enzyme
MLASGDPLPRRPRRIIVAGVSGVGKTTLAGRIATVTGAPHTEIDGLFHGTGWEPRLEFLADVDAFTSETAWVTEFQYGSARPMLAARADLLVWLDLPFPVTLARVVRRTVARRLRRTELWNGNVEPPLATFFTDPEHIVRWAVRTRHKYRESMPAVTAAHPELVVVRIRRARDVDRWVDGPLAAAVDGAGPSRTEHADGDTRR